MKTRGWTFVRARGAGAALLLATLLALGGCGAPTTPPTNGDGDPTPQRVAGTATAFDGATPVSVGVIMSVLREPLGPPDDDLGLLEPARASWPIVDLGSGIFAGAFVPLEADGSFELSLPLAEEVPEALYRSADAFVQRVERIDGCTLVASDPAARATGTYGFLDVLIDDPDEVFRLFFITTNLIALGTDGMLVGIVSVDPWIVVDPAGADPEPVVAGTVTWVHADRAFDAVSAGTCSADGVTLDVDVRLDEGWNQITWQLLEGGVLSLRSRDAEADVHVLFVDPADLLESE